MIFLLAIGFFIVGQTLGCRYKGINYEEGDIILIDEPCLSCKCHHNSLECNTRVCSKFMDLLPLEGCSIVHRENQCCPHVECESRINMNTGRKIDFNAETTTVTATTATSECLINGTIYSEGSALPSYNLCEYCYCIKGQKRCVKPHCPRLADYCVPNVSENSCCPSQYSCETSKNFTGCFENEIHYEEGSVMPSDKHCQQCFCFEGAKKCSSISCTIQHLDGCFPVYAPDQCCPSTYNCSLNGAIKRIDEFIETTAGFTEETTRFTEAIQTEESTTENDKPTTEISTFETSGEIETITTTIEETTKPTSDIMLKSSLTRKTNSETATQSNEDIVESNNTAEEEYESYDYGEPKLPPSLPNLVIIPFVAADAVTKEKNEIKRREDIDDPLYFSNGNQFSPPVETEGGFVPKDEPVVEIPVYDTLYISTTETQIHNDLNFTPPSITTILPNTDNCISDGIKFKNGDKISEIDCVLCVCNHGEILCEDKISCNCSDKLQNQPSLCCNKCNGNFSENLDLGNSTESPSSQLLTIVAPVTVADTIDLTPDPFRDVLHTEPAPDLHSLMNDLPPHLVTGKPVTVINQHEVTDYYPEHEVTTVNKPPQTTTNHQKPTFIEEFLLGFFDSQKELNTTVEKPKNKTRKPTKTKRPNTTTVKPINKSPFVTEQDTGFPKINILEQDEDKQPRKPIKNLVDLGAVLKLAGCNIYGRMYRVGKIIAELSGPCLECMCTDTGVQCSKLIC